MLHAIWATASSGFFRAPAWIGVEKSAQVNANTKRKHSRALSATACVWCIYHWCHTPNAYARTCSGHVSERKFIILLYKHIHIYAGVYMCLCVCVWCVESKQRLAEINIQIKMWIFCANARCRHCIFMYTCALTYSHK